MDTPEELELNAWVVDWDLQRGLKEVEGVPDAFQSVHYFGAYFDISGNISVPQELHMHLVSPDNRLKGSYLTVVNDVVQDGGSSIQKDAKVVEYILKDENRQQEHIKELVDLVLEYPLKGIILDYEKIPNNMFHDYAVFIERLGTSLKDKGAGLKVVLEPGSPVDSVDLPEGYEYIIMAYNLHDTRTSPGSKADYKFIEDMSAKLSRNIQHGSIAFSLGGFDWSEKGAVALTELEAEKLLADRGAEKKMSVDSGAAYFDYVDDDGIEHTVYYADEETVINWIQTACEKGISSIYLWRLGGSGTDTLAKVKDAVKSDEFMDSMGRMDREDKKSGLIKGVLTGHKIVSLTINGLPREEETEKLLYHLDELNIKATFFISGVKAAEEPETVKMILERGHELGNSNLTGADLTKESYDEKIRQIKKSHDAIAKHAGVEPKYLRPGHGAVDEDVLMAAGNCGYDNVVTFSINPQDWDSKTPQEVAKLVDERKLKGGIIILNGDKNPMVSEAIPLIHEKLSSKGYKIVPLRELVEIHDAREKNLYTGYRETAKVDPEYKNTDYRIIEHGPPGKKPRVAITFDDWGTDDTIDGILDVLDKYNVKATFFLRAAGVLNNPSLALAMYERGHEIANHTYSHKDLNLLSPLEIQEDIVKAHRVIAEAINSEPAMFLRPPRGIVNPEVARAAAACGYGDIVMYSVTALDWKDGVTAEDITNIMMDKAFDGAILLLHMLDNINTTEALPSIIEGLRAKGYSFVTVGEMLNN